MQHPTGGNPPKGEWTDSLGRRAGEVYHDPYGRRRIVTPPEFHADDGTVTTGHEAIATLTAEIDADQAKRARWTLEQRKAAVRYYECLNAELDRRTAAKRSRGWAPGEAFDFSAEWRAASRSAAKAVSSRSRQRPRGAGRPRVRIATRSSAKSGDSGSDSDEPEPSEEGVCGCGCDQPRRYCACGCRREITHRRADAKTFAASCRQKIKRAADRERLEPMAARACQCQGGFFYRDAEGDAVCGLCGCWLARTATRINGFDGFDALLRSNGVYIAPRLLPREWRTRLPRRSPVTKGAPCRS